MQTDPIAAMGKLYGEMGEELGIGTRNRMSDWWDKSSKDRRRGKRPDPTAYGLDVSTLRADFAFYHDRFGIPLDGDGGR
jgi:hypothetical protein